MTKIPPPPPNKAPKDLKPFIEQWLEAKAQLEAYKESEMTMRKFLVAQLFPVLEEGVNTVTKPGLEASCKHSVYRKVDKAAYSTMSAELRKKGINLDVLIEMEPHLVLKAYHQLDARKRKLFESVLTISDGAPSLTINLGK